MNFKNKIRTCPIIVAAALAVLNPNFSFAQAQTPVIEDILPEKGAAAGHGQLITIQGLNLIKNSDLGATTVTFTSKKTGDCSDVFIFPSPSTSDELYVRLFNSGGPCDIGKGKYTVTVSTPDGTSNLWPYQVKSKPEAPILRKVLFPGEPGCPEDPPEIDICVQAYGTDTSHITAVFRQEHMKISVPLFMTVTSPTFGLVHGFKLPELTSGETASVQLFTTVNEVASKLSSPLEFTVP